MGTSSRFPLLFTMVAVLAAMSPLDSPAQTVEYFDQTNYAAVVGPRNIVGFDVPAQQDNALLGQEYLGVGVTLIQTDGGQIHIVGNLAPGGFGSNYVTEANVDTLPNAISSSTTTTGAADISDNFDFVLTNPTTAAGLVVGNLGNCSVTNATSVQFLDEFDAVIAEEVLAQHHLDIVWGTATDGICGPVTPLPFDNRLFYGIVTDQQISRIRVLNGASDGDGILIDSVQFKSTAISVCGFEAGDACTWMGRTP